MFIYFEPYAHARLRCRIIGFINRSVWMLVIAILLMGVNHGAMAQGREFGLTAGLMAAQTLNQGEQVEDFLPGVYGGFFVGRPVGSTFFTSFISGLEYIQNGYMTDDQNFRKLHYFHVPLAFRFHFGPWHLQTGAGANFKFYERWLVNGSEMLHLNNRSLWIDLPIQLGAGVRIMDVIVEAKFLIGLLDVYEGNRNSSFQLGLAYSF